MGFILASENLKEFVHLLSSENYRDIDEMTRGYLKNFKLIADDIKLGQAAAVYIAPKTTHNPEGMKKLNIIFINPNGFSDDVYERNYGTGEGGTITLTFNPVEDHEWNEEELKEIDFLADLMFIVASRTRLTSKIIEMTSIINSIHAGGNPNS